MNIMKPSDQQLQAVLAKILPNKIAKFSTGIAFCEVSDDEIARLGMVYGDWVFAWRNPVVEIRDKEWLYACWLAERELADDELNEFCRLYTLRELILEPWQNQAENLALVKGIQIT